VKHHRKKPGDKVLKNSNGSKVLASTNMETGEIRINPVETIEEFFDYFEGKVPSPTSNQKKIVLARLNAKHGWPKTKIRQLIKTPDQANRFLVLHEADYVANLENDRAVYRRNPKNLMSPEKIIVETRASKNALDQLAANTQSEKINIRGQRGMSIEPDIGVEQDSEPYMKKRIRAAVGPKLYKTITFATPPTTGGANKTTLGLFENNTGEIFVDLSLHQTAEAAINTTWHELFHSGVQERFIGDKNRANAEEYIAIMEEARGNETIGILASAVYRTRGWDTGLQNGVLFDLSVEEAMVELAAAIKTNSTRDLEQRYNVRLPKSFIQGRETRELLERFLDFIGRLIFPKNTLYKISKDTSDARILEIIRESGNAIAASRQKYLDNRPRVVSNAEFAKEFQDDKTKQFSEDIGLRQDQIIKVAKKFFENTNVEQWSVGYRPTADWVARYLPSTNRVKLNAAFIESRAQALWAMRKVTESPASTEIYSDSALKSSRMIPEKNVANEIILSRWAKNLREKGFQILKDENGEYYVVDKDGNRVSEETENIKSALNDIPHDLRYNTLEEALEDPEIQVRLGWMLAREAPGGIPRAGFYTERYVNSAGELFEDFMMLAVDSLDPLSFAFHEGMHKFVAKLGESGNRDLYDRMVKAATAPHVLKQMERMLADYPRAIADMRRDPEEAVAYAFQFYAASRLPGGPEFRIQPSFKELLTKIVHSIARMLGIMTHARASQKIFDALFEGRVQQEGIEPLRKYQERSFKQYAEQTMRAIRESVPRALSSPIIQLQRLKNAFKPS
jgi:hypothetical protein